MESSQENFRLRAQQTIRSQKEELETFSVQMEDWKRKFENFCEAFIEEAQRCGIEESDIKRSIEKITFTKFHREYGVSFNSTSMHVGKGKIDIAPPQDYMGHPEAILTVNNHPYSLVFHSQKYWVGNTADRGKLDRYTEFPLTRVTGTILECAIDA